MNEQEIKYIDYLERNDIDIVCSNCDCFVDEVNENGLCKACEVNLNR